jgi:hypothetical protein
MSRGSWLFTPTEIDRLIKCAKKHDLQNYRIDITRDGKTLSLIVGEAAKANDNIVTEDDLKRLL